MLDYHLLMLFLICSSSLRLNNSFFQIQFSVHIFFFLTIIFLRRTFYANCMSIPQLILETLNLQHIELLLNIITEIFFN